MHIEYAMDPAGVIESIFARMFITLFNSDGARNHFGFSKINLYSNIEGMPGWHLWLDGQPGAYQIELSDCEINSDVEPAPVNLPIRGELIVRYFPALEEEIFTKFSFYEQMLRYSELFDPTGTPTIEGRQNLHPSYYTTGHIKIRTRPERDMLEITCCSPKRWKTIQTEGLKWKTEKGKIYTVVTPGGTDRDIPAWELCYFIFKKLVSAFCHLNKGDPIIAAFAAAAGKMWIIDGKGHIQEQETENQEHFNLLTMLWLDKNHNEGAFSPGTYAKQVRSRFMNNDSNAKVFHKKPAGNDPEWIDPQWWIVKGLHFPNEHQACHCCYGDH